VIGRCWIHPGPWDLPVPQVPRARQVRRVRRERLAPQGQPVLREFPVP